MRDTRLERFLRRERIKPAHLARESGYSRQYLLRVRRGLVEPTRACIASILAACSRLSGRRVSPDELFELTPGEDRRRVVLLVEDDDRVREGLASLLEQEGWQVISAEDVRSARREADVILPAVVVSDVGLPDGDGASLYLELEARYPGLPVVLISGEMPHPALRELLSRGTVRFLLKPFDFEQLLSLIRALTF